MNSRGAEAFSAVRTPSVMDRNAGRHGAVLTYWKCKISYVHFCRWLPNYILAVHVTCHLVAAVILSVQHRGTHCHIVMSLLCKSAAALAQPCMPSTTQGWVMLHTQIHTFTSAGISKSTNLTDKRCSFWVSFSFDLIYEYQTVLCDSEKQDLWLPRAYTADRSLDWNSKPVFSVWNMQPLWSRTQFAPSLSALDWLSFCVCVIIRCGTVWLTYPSNQHNFQT